MKKIILRLCAALLGIAIGAMVFCTIAVVKVQGSEMLPILEPGSNVVIWRLHPENVKAGDIVAIKAPYFTESGEGNTYFRKVESVGNAWFRVTAGDSNVVSGELIVSAEDIWGRVIYGKKRT